MLRYSHQLITNYLKILLIPILAIYLCNQSLHRIYIELLDSFYPATYQPLFILWLDVYVVHSKTSLAKEVLNLQISIQPLMFKYILCTSSLLLECSIDLYFCMPLRMEISLLQGQKDRLLQKIYQPSDHHTVYFRVFLEPCNGWFPCMN